MPGMTGEAIISEIRKIRPDIPIIICTGYSETMTPERANAMGIKDFVFKPILARDLAVIIRKALDGEP